MNVAVVVTYKIKVIFLDYLKFYVLLKRRKYWAKPRRLIQRYAFWRPRGVLYMYMYINIHVQFNVLQNILSFCLYDIKTHHK
jgi:hypothetical protein